MLQHIVTWMRTQSQHGDPRGRWARWLGRNWARWTYAVRVEPTWLELNQHQVPIADLAHAFAGFRIVQLSDLHCSRQVTGAYLAEAVELAQAQNPDVIALTGDFIHKGFRHVEAAARVVGRLRAPMGVFAVLGNHDFSVRNALGVRRFPRLHQAVADALTAHGIRVLHNETVTLSRGGARLHLCGVADLWSRACDLERAFHGLCPGVPRVVLAHNPRTIEHLDGHRCDLMLSGHTHGGQINLPKLGRITLGKKGKRFAAGMYFHDNSFLYVNKGVGFGLKIRYNVRPEVAVMILKPGPRGNLTKGAVHAPPD
jgi:predicted MPP superfamily phosphohydrolase